MSRKRQLVASQALTLAVLAATVLQFACGRGATSRATVDSGAASENPPALTQEGQTPKPLGQVPAQYEELYSLLLDQVGNFEQQIAASWDGSRHDVIFSAALLPANPNLGPVLVEPQTFDVVLLFLDRFQEMGLTGVTLDVNYPLVTPAFHEDEAARAQYIDFYQRVVAAARQRGMTVAVEQQVIFPDYSPLPVADYYAELNFDRFKAEFLDTSITIVEQIQPDYLSIGNEPDTAAYNTGLPLDDLDNYMELLQFVLDGLAGHRSQLQIGAGFGTWLPSADLWAQRFTGETDIDYLNLHVYPLDAGLMERTLDLAQIAQAAGKPIAIHESWAYKWQLGETTAVPIAETYFARDAYSFWQPLDQAFVAALVKFAHAYKLEYLSFFWSNYFFAYLNYDEASGLAPDRLRREANRAALSAARAGEFSLTGLHYADLIDSGE